MSVRYKRADIKNEFNQLCKALTNYLKQIWTKSRLLHLLN